MTRRTAILNLLVLLLATGAVGGIALLPKRHKVSEQLLQTVLFWNDQDAFVFLTTNMTGRSGNVLQERLETWEYYPYLSVLVSDLGFFKMGRTVYYLRPPGRLERVELPAGSAPYGTWSLHEGKLQSNPPPFSPPGSANGGFRWNGSEFVAVAQVSPAPETQADKERNEAPADLTPDDLSEREREDDEISLVATTDREAFRKAGWHYKTVRAYDAKGKEANLPLVIGQSSFRLTLRSFPLPSDGDLHLDPLSLGAKSVEISGDNLTPRSQVLWTQAGWKEISKAEYQALVAKHGITPPQSSSTRLWVLALVAIMLLQVGKPLAALFSVATLKGRLLKNMATAYSFPPVTTAQFPLLDQRELDRYTQELEGLGFRRLLDFSLVADAASHPSSFCRLFAHPRHRCFAEANQIFPNGKAPLPMKCSVMSYMQDGWSVSFTDRSPMAMSSLFRRPKAIGACLPTSTTAGLLDSLLKLRAQACTDLAITPLGDATLEVYMAEMQRSLLDMRAAFQGRNLAAGFSIAGLRKLAALKPSAAYTWLGDYPKEAQRRKFGASILPR